MIFQGCADLQSVLLGELVHAVDTDVKDVGRSCGADAALGKQLEHVLFGPCVK